MIRKNVPRCGGGDRSIGGVLHWLLVLHTLDFVTGLRPGVLCISQRRRRRSLVRRQAPRPGTRTVRLLSTVSGRRGGCHGFRLSVLDKDLLCHRSRWTFGNEGIRISSVPNTDVSDESKDTECQQCATDCARRRRGLAMRW